MNTFLTERFAIRLARGLTRDFTNGNGTNCPRGIMLDAVAGPTAVGAYAGGNNSNSNNTAWNSYGTTDVLGLVHSVDPLYRINGKFMMHDLTIQVLEQQLDNFGRPLYIPNPQTGKLESLFGYPIVFNQYMPQLNPSPAAVVDGLLFGDLKKYVIRKVKDFAVLRLVERAAEQGLVLFIGFARYDGRLIDAGTHPVKYLISPAA
jgi:HK97 family phage major capsid protein